LKPKRVLSLIVIIAGAAAGALWWWARESLPSLDGNRRLVGLNAPVEVLTDDHGVPHVYAEGPEDAWFTVGVLHARDRLWQMEVYRRAAYGRLSEILGERTLRIDRRLLTLGLRDSAEAEWRVAPPAVRNALTRYVAGVNAYIAEATGRRLPLEFQLLRTTPAPWTPVDSLVVGRLLAWRLAENHQGELVRHALAARFGPSEAVRLGGAYPSDAPSVIQGPPGAAHPAPSAARGPTGEAGPTLSNARGPTANEVTGPTLREARGPEWPLGLEWLHPSARRGNSNNWVLSGRRTASGRPLLANDPHLQLEFPGVWYETHLVAAGLDVIGVSIPGAPFVILGHNARIAWGMTNTGADVQDLFVERVDLARRQYFYRGQWLPVDIVRSQIPVRGGDPSPFETWRTRHGTLFAEVGLDWEDAPAWLSPTNERSGERQVFALRWASGASEMAGAFEALDRAGSWQEFTAAVERFAAPSQNIVYADVEGNIGYAMSGALPQRSSGVGLLPLDGANGEGEWTGQINGSALPRVLNPGRGYITSSNNVIDRQWSGLVTRDWAAPYRAARLHTLIASAERIDLATAAQWQNDVTGVAAADVLSELDSAIDIARKRRVDSAVLGALEQLKAWDRQVDARPVVTLFQVFEDALWRRTFFDEMGDDLFNRFYEWAGAERPAGLYAVVHDSSSRWWDDIATIERRETRDDMYILAASDAAERMSSEYGVDMSWSQLHVARFEHPLGGVAWPFAWLFNRGPTPLTGDGTTVMRVSYHRLRPFAAWELPSWRQLIDVGNWDESLVVLPAGQSGHPLSRNYFDQNELWRQGQYRRQPFSRSAVLETGAHRLLFLP